MDLACEYTAQCKIRRIEDEKRNDLRWQSCHDLFNKFWEDTCKLFKEDK